MEKFTEGPWRVGKNSSGSIEVYIGNSFTNARHNEYMRIGIATDTDGGDCTNNPKVEANAHLIAAAPEMYEMLNNIAISMECEHGVDTNAIFELLAKARGELCGK
jgi:hypothetical protein